VLDAVGDDTVYETVVEAVEAHERRDARFTPFG